MDFIPRRLLDQAFQRLRRSELIDRLHAVRALAAVRGVRYLDDRGRSRLIEIALKPWVLTSAQVVHFHRAMSTLAEALRRLPALYARDPAVRQLLRFDAGRASWLALARHPRSRPMAVVGRLDSTASYDHARWRDFQMLEPNTVGVGGVHYAPVSCGVLLDVVGDVLRQALPGRRITPTPDPRHLLLDELRLVRRRLGRPLRGVALVENTEYATGTDEFVHLARYLTAQGVRAVVVDPRGLHLRRGQVHAGALAIDLVYRDCELQEFVDMEAGGRPLAALRQAVREGRLISGLHWEFDQKAAWELFTDPRYSRYFTPTQRRFFRDHVLWTRLVRQASTRDRQGRLVDLVPYIRRHRARLVLKPNMLYGGQGVVLGCRVSQRIWEQQLGQALRGRQRYVVQELACVAAETFPSLADGGVKTVRRASVSGFFFNSAGIGLIGRFSASPVVNVSQGGGLIAALWAH